MWKISNTLTSFAITAKIVCYEEHSDEAFPRRSSGVPVPNEFDFSFVVKQKKTVLIRERLSCLDKPNDLLLFLSVSFAMFPRGPEAHSETCFAACTRD